MASEKQCIYYFAYGSNMDQHQMKNRCPDSIAFAAGLLKNYQLCFPKYSKTRKCGVASIKEFTGAEVYGVIYKLSESDLSALDICEGHVPGSAASFYHREKREIELTSAGIFLSSALPATSILTCEVYIANCDCSEKVKPSEAYISHFLEGVRPYENKGIPSSYIQFLQNYLSNS